VQSQVRYSDQTILEKHSWGISAITLWEMVKLSQLGRLEFDFRDPECADFLRQLHVWPVTSEIALATQRLDFRGDPADEIIAATSLVHDVPLLTHDRRILKSKIVPLAS
jgi:PIN domain nuclease of toxin-antitoxin system